MAFGQRPERIKRADHMKIWGKSVTDGGNYAQRPWGRYLVCLVWKARRPLKPEHRKWGDSDGNEVREMGKKDQAMQVLYKLRKEPGLFISYVCWEDTGRLRTEEWYGLTYAFLDISYLMDLHPNSTTYLRQDNECLQNLSFYSWKVGLRTPTSKFFLNKAFSIVSGHRYCKIHISSLHFCFFCIFPPFTC